MAKGKKKENLTPEERLQAALVPDSERPYKVPENWCWAYWGACGNFQAGSAFKNEYQGLTEYEIPFYKVGSLKYSNSDGFLYDTSNTVSEEIRNKLKAVLIPENSIIFAKIGEAIRLNRRSINPVACCIDNNLMSFYARTCLTKYVYFWSLGIDLYNYTNATTVPSIRKSDLEKVPFPLSPYTEQQRIVDRIESLFAKLDEAKQKTQDALDSFETRKAAILHKAFTGELTTQWRKEHGLGMESWNETILKDVCKVNPKKIDVNGLPDDLEVSFFPMASLSETYGEITKPQTRLLKDVKNGFTNFSEGDVVFAKITPCMENGKSAIIGKLVNGIGYGTTEFYVLRCNEKLYNRYLYHMVRDTSFRNKAKAVMSGAVGQQRVPKSFMENYPLNLPSVPEQAEIVRILDDLLAKEQQAKESAEAVLEQIDLIKKSILARAFRGELGTNDPAEESSIELLKQNFGETIKSEKVKPKQVTNKKAKVIFVRKTIMETLSRGMSLTPENLKSETGLPIDDFYAQLKELVNNGSVVERRENGESYLEVANENR
ncbi:MAG: restriction endonuclease subunit S [Clostridiales bacterium]|nr:restriction endonuclease subunit S [Clostridiales bacterium]